jgi:Helix-turn-helix domain
VKTLADLRALAESLPPGWPVTLPREALLEMLGDVPASETGLLTVSQIAAQLHRSPSTVRGWCEAGRFAGAFKLEGRDWRVPAHALESFLSGQLPHEGERGRTIGTRADTGVARPRGPTGDKVSLRAWRQLRGGPRDDSTQSREALDA